MRIKLPEAVERAISTTDHGRYPARHAHLLNRVPNNRLTRWTVRRVSLAMRRAGSMHGLKMRGRGSRQEHGDRQDISLDFASHFAVYLTDRAAMQRRRRKRWIQEAKARREADAQRERVTIRGYFMAALDDSAEQVPVIELADGSSLVVWRDEEQNGPGALVRVNGDGQRLFIGSAPNRGTVGRWTA